MSDEDEMVDEQTKVLKFEEDFSHFPMRFGVRCPHGHSAEVRELEVPFHIYEWFRFVSEEFKQLETALMAIIDEKLDQMESDQKAESRRREFHVVKGGSDDKK